MRKVDKSLGRWSPSDFFGMRAIFAKLPAEQRGQIESSATVRAVERDTVIFATGSEDRRMYGVLAGAVVTPLVDSKELLFSLVFPGEMFSKHPQVADAIAATDVELLVIDLDEFMPILGANPESAAALDEFLRTRRRWFRWRRQAANIPLAEQAVVPFRQQAVLARLLLAWTSGDDLWGEPSVTVDMGELWRIVEYSMPRELGRRVLRMWANQDFVALDRGTFGITILDPDGIATIAASRLSALAALERG
jgi:CRP-like cAMP-binding protein